jgi:hypothetical protein
MLRIETHKQAHKQLISSQANGLRVISDHKLNRGSFLTHVCARTCIELRPPKQLVIACEPVAIESSEKGTEVPRLTIQLHKSATHQPVESTE